MLICDPEIQDWCKTAIVLYLQRFTYYIGRGKMLDEQEKLFKTDQKLGHAPKTAETIIGGCNGKLVRS